MDFSLWRKIARFFGLNKNIVGLLLMVVLVGLGERMAERFLPIYLMALGGGAMTIGLLGGLTNLISALYSFPGGYLSDRLGYKKALLIFNLISLVGYGIVIIFPYWQAVIIGALFFLAWSAISLPATMSLVSDVLPQDKRTMGVTLHSLVRRVPMALGPIFGGVLIGIYGEKDGVRLAFAVAFLLGIASIILQQKMIVADSPKGQEEKRPSRLWRYMSPALRSLLISDVLIRFAEQIPYAFVVVWCIKYNGITATRFGLLTAIEMITAVLVYIPVAWLADRAVWMWVAAIGLYVLLTYVVLGTDQYLNVPVTTAQKYLSGYLAAGIFAILVVFPAIFVAERAGPVRRILAHPVLAFIAPVVIAEAHLVGRSGVIAGMPPRLAAALGSPRGRGWAAALLALVLAAHHSATPSGPLVHGASALANTLVVAALIWWWHRRYAARPLPTLRDTLPGTRATIVLAGFLVNAGAPPLSAWLPDAYPEASWSGTVFLSAFTTKTAVYVLLRAFPGTELLVFVGLFMIFYGIVYALLENDMRRILAYSIVNQVGFMIVGIGIGTEMSLNGAAAHAFTHILYKALLLMSAGAVLYETGRRKCTDLGGLFRTMPVTMVCIESWVVISSGHRYWFQP